MKKKVGDLTLREVVKLLELVDMPCLNIPCEICRIKRSAIHAMCEAGIAYDKKSLDLEEEIEVEENV